MDAADVITRLEGEIERLSQALATQRSCYERLLEEEREERRSLLEASATRLRRWRGDMEALRRLGEEHERLIASHARAGRAYRESLAALRRSYELQISGGNTSSRAA
jgi:chromosome segregation ATPase